MTLTSVYIYIYITIYSGKIIRLSRNYKMNEMTRMLERIMLYFQYFLADDWHIDPRPFLI